MRQDSNESLLYDLKVYDDATGEMLGYVTSMDDDGLEMELDKAIDLERESFFTIENILEMEPGHVALFAAICDQCDAEKGRQQRFHAKLTFTQLSAEAEEIKKVLH